METAPRHIRRGLFVDLACHTLDILDYLFGPITAVVGHATSQLNAYPAEDCVSASFLFENGMHGTGMWNFASYDRYDNVEIVGNEGKISFATFGDTDILIHKSAEVVQKVSINNPVHIEQPLITSVVQELLGDGQCPSTGATAARTNWVMDQVLSGYKAYQ